MPFSSGVYSRVYNWVTEQLSSPIEISKLDTQEEDIATALSNCILRDGTGLPTAAQDWNGQNLTNVAAFTATGIVTGGRFVPTSSSAPTNGMYLSAANTLAFSSNSTLRWSVNSTGNHTIAAPSSGTALTVNGLAGAAAVAATFTDATNWTFRIGRSASTSSALLNSAGAMILATNDGTTCMTLGASGNVTIAAPSSGTTLSVSGVSGANSIVADNLKMGFNVGIGSSAYTVYADSGNPLYIGTSGAAAARVYTNNTSRIEVGSAGNVTVNAPSSGVSLSVAQVSGGRGIDITGTSPEFRLQDSGANAALIAIRATNTANILDFSWGTGSLPASIRVGATEAIGITAARNVTIAAPSSGATLITTTGASLVGQRWTDGTRTLEVQQDSGGSFFGNTSNHALGFFTNNAQRVSIAATGGLTVNNPSSGTGLTVAGGGADITGTVTATTFSGSGASLTSLPAGNLTGTVASARISGSYTGITAIGASCTVDGVTVGFRSVPRSTTTTTAATTDVGKCIAASAGITIPNATFAAGDCLSIYNDSASSITITQGASLTLRLAGTTTTGNLTLQPRGMATVWFNTASEAIASGSGLG